MTSAPRWVEIEVDVILAVDAAAGADFPQNAARDHVPGRQVLDRGGVALHEALPVLVAQDAAFAAGGLADEDPQLVDAGRVELDEFHVLQRGARPIGDGHAISGGGHGVGGCLVDLAGPARGQQHRLAVEDVDVAGGKLAGDRPAAAPIDHDQLDHVEFMKKADARLQGFFPERVEDDPAGAVGRIAGALDGRLAEIARVAAEGALRDLALRGAVERHPHVLELNQGAGGVLGHDLDRVLVAEVIAALDRVEHVPLPAVRLLVAEGRADPALGGARVRAGGEDLGQNGDPGILAEFDGGPQAGQTGSDNDDIVTVFHKGILWWSCACAASGSNERTAEMGLGEAISLIFLHKVTRRVKAILMAS